MHGLNFCLFLYLLFIIVYIIVYIVLILIPFSLFDETDVLVDSSKFTIWTTYNLNA